MNLLNDISIGTVSKATAGAEPRDRRRGIDRVIMLLEALLRHRAPLRVGDIAKMIDAPRSTTYEIVNSLLEAELLENVGADGYVYFGRAMHLFGWAYGHHNAHYRRIVEAMERMAADTGETVQICGLRGNKYIVFDCRDSPGPFRISSDVGVDVPIPWTASGRLLLGHLSDDEIRALVPPEDYRLPDGRIIDGGRVPRRNRRSAARSCQRDVRTCGPLHLVHGGADQRLPRAWRRARCASCCPSTRRKGGDRNFSPCCANGRAACRCLAAEHGAGTHAPRSR